MKYLVLLILILTTTLGFGQTFPKGLPSPNSNGYSKIGYSQFDSGMIQIQRDTFNAKYPTVIRYLDGNLWQTLGNGNRWYVLKSASILSIYAGYGLTKINDSTISVDSSLIATRLRVQKAVDSLGVVKQPYNANTTILGNTTTGSGSTIVLSGSPTLTLPNISAINVSGGIAALPTGSGTLAYTSALSSYKPLNDSSYNTGYTTRVQTKRVIDSLGATKQPLENQRLSTTDNPTFGDITGTGIITLTNTGTSLTQWRAAYPVDASGRISVIDVGRSAGIWASYNDLNQRVGYIGDSADAMKYVAEIGTHNFNANVNVTADINAVNLNLTNKITADSLVIIGGTDSQILQAAGGVITAGTGITISAGTISASGSFAYNTIDPNGSGGQSYIPANYPAALLMGGLYGGYIAVTTGGYTVNGNSRFIELKTGASAVGISSTASGQEFYLVNTTGSAISISFTLKDLSGTTLTTVPANSSYHIFYNGTTYLKL